MQFGIFSVGDVSPDPVTGRVPSEAERISNIVRLAQKADELGLDVFAIGEHHNPPFVPSSPPALLAHIAALTKQIILSTSVTLITTNDPVKIAEDYATAEILTRGRTVFGSLTFQRDAAVKQRVEEVAEMIFLKDRLHTYADVLSHGQKQWLEIGMLLIQDPDLLMLDEPVAGMSVSERAKTAELLNRIIKDRSVLVIEHDMKFVEDIAHKVTVLHQGQILSEGTMEKVKNDPKVIEVYLGH